MNYAHTFRALRRIGMLFLLPAALFIGCQNNATGPDTADSEVTDEDIAISVANLICEDSGGALDQIGDVLEMIGMGMQSPALKSDPAAGILVRTAEYDSVQQIWTISFTKERGTAGDSLYSLFSRTYSLQLFSRSGSPQQYWITEEDTARTFDVAIIAGTGLHHGPHFTHTLTAIDGSWQGSGADTPLITINGNIHRAAIDTIYRPLSMKISDHAVNLTLSDVTGPRGSRVGLTEKVSGTVSGQFTADVTVYRENMTITRHIVRDISVDLSAGRSRIKIGPQWFVVHPGSGEISDS
ncbi:hypothetical protein JXO52_06180 [bacterium]|nr:hypothetical protein [bacterium]